MQIIDSYSMYRFTLQYFFPHMSHRPCVVQGPQSIKRLLPRALPDLRLERGEVTKRSLGLARLFLQRQDLWHYACATCAVVVSSALLALRHQRSRRRKNLPQLQGSLTWHLHGTGSVLMVLHPDHEEVLNARQNKIYPQCKLISNPQSTDK